MKTATIRVNLLFGTSHEFCADVMYRGFRLWSFFGLEPNDLKEKARVWALNQGFSHCKYVFG